MDPFLLDTQALKPQEKQRQSQKIKKFSALFPHSWKREKWQMWKKLEFTSFKISLYYTASFSIQMHQPFSILVLSYFWCGA